MAGGRQAAPTMAGMLEAKLLEGTSQYSPTMGPAVQSRGRADSENSIASAIAQGGRTLRLAARLQLKGKNLSLFSVYAYSVNYILGVGALGIPFAIFTAGWALSGLMLVTVSSIAFITAIMVARTVVRAELLSLLPCENGELSSWCCLQPHDADGKHENEEKDPDLMCVNCATNCSKEAVCFEVTQLCLKFLQKRGQFAYQTALIILMCTGLVAYAQVFISTLMGFELARGTATIIAACFLVPLSCLDLTEMTWLQTCIFGLTASCLLTILAVSVWAVFSDPFDGYSHTSGPPYVEPLEAFKMDGFASVFSTILFAQLFQPAVPSFQLGLSLEDRPKAPRVFAAAIVSTSSLYACLGLACALYFGPLVQPNITLNFAAFTWGEGTGSSCPLILQGLRKFCSLYPLFSVPGCFPLITVTLANNLRAASHHAGQDGCGAVLISRLLTSVPPVVVAYFVDNLQLTFKVAGLAGIWVAFVTPALLQYYSKRAVRRNFRRLQSQCMKNPVHESFNGSIWVIAILLFSGFAFVITAGQLISSLRSL